MWRQILLKFYYNKNEDVIKKDPFCCKHLEEDWYDEQLNFKCFEGHKIKVFGMSERLSKFLTECPYCHEKIVTELIND